jgi:hypothetical protein
MQKDCFNCKNDKPLPRGGFACRESSDGVVAMWRIRHGRPPAGKDSHRKMEHCPSYKGHTHG